MPEPAKDMPLRSKTSDECARAVSALADRLGESAFRGDSAGDGEIGRKMPSIKEGKDHGRCAWRS